MQLLPLIPLRHDNPNSLRISRFVSESILDILSSLPEPLGPLPVERDGFTGFSHRRRAV